MIDAAVSEVKQQYLTGSMMASTRGHCEDHLLYGTQQRDIIPVTVHSKKHGSLHAVMILPHVTTAFWRCLLCRNGSLLVFFVPALLFFKSVTVKALHDWFSGVQWPNYTDFQHTQSQQLNYSILTFKYTFNFKTVIGFQTNMFLSFNLKCVLWKLLSSSN